MIELPNAVVLKIKSAFVDERGDILNLLRADAPFVHVGCSRTKAGVRRSDHYHPEGTEFLWLENGEYEQWTKKVEGKAKQITAQVEPSGDLIITVGGEKYAHFKKGEYELQTEFKEENGTEKRQIKERSLIITPPGTAHAMLFSKDSLFFWFTSKPRGSAEGYEDTVSYKNW